MRRIVSAAFVLLAACVPAVDAPSVSDPCGAPNQVALIGQSAAVIPDAAPGQSRRIIRPGDSVTEEFSDRRINYHLDAADRVVRITCG